MTGVSASCGACKFLRRKCTKECVFAPYFSHGPEAASQFAAVHKVYGASNVSRLLLHLPEHHRRQAALSISFQALARVRDPVYGCVAYIYALQLQVANLQEEIDVLGNQMANLNTGVTDDHYACNFQATTNYNNPMNNNNINNVLHLAPQPQESPILNLPDQYWSTNTMNDNNDSNKHHQEDQVLVMEAEYEACNNHILISNNDTNSLPLQPIDHVWDCEWEDQQLPGNIISEELNQCIFDSHPYIYG